MVRDDRLLAALAEAVGEAHLLVEPRMVEGYVTDWTGRWRGHTPAVVRPADTGQVRRVVTLCAEAGAPLIPQGGNTGLVGGSVPHRGEIVLSLRRLDRLDPVDVDAGEVRVGSGVTLGALQAHAAGAGLSYGVDLAARDSATVGGTIATNAGGVNVVAHGDTARQVVGLEAVLADGTVVSSMRRVGKESVGPDPLRLLVGSEGTLGVITAARLRLVSPPPSDRMVTLVAVDSLAEGLGLRSPDTLALEFLDRACLLVVAEHRGLPLPLPADSPYYLLIDSTHPPDLPDDAHAVVDRRLWVFREAITDTLSRIGVPVKLDVAVPPPRVDALAEAVMGLGLEGDVYLFGHLGEGNFHVNVLGASDPDRVVDRVLEVVIGLGGAIAGEHGIGVAKSSWWRRSTDPGLLRVQRKIKDSLDPDHLLNPEVFWGGG